MLTRLPHLLEEFGHAFGSLRRHPLRTALTTLGIVFGVAAVLCMLAVGTGAREQIQREIGSLGIDNIYLRSREPQASARATEEKSEGVKRFGLTLADLAQIRVTVPGIERVISVHTILQRVYYRARPVAAEARGVPPEYLANLGLVITQGRTLTQLDESLTTRVALVSQSFLDELGHLGNPLDAVVNVGGTPLDIVGIYEPRGASAIDGTSQGAMPIVYLPLSSSYRYFGTRAAKQSSGSFENVEQEVSEAIVRVAAGGSVATVSATLARLLEHFHPNRDYEVVVPLDLLHQRQRTQAIFDIVLFLIASISLIVGGIGIVNIMLATISERTREIGVRRAIGATRADIRRHFLIETVTIAIVGGLSGCLLGLAGAAIVARTTGWPATVGVANVVLALGISAGVGVLAGLYPANRAATMDPMTALRHE